MGTLGGLLGALFHHALHFVTHLRLQNTWLIFLLPLGGLLTVWIYRVFDLRNNRGTNEIIDAVLDGHAVSPLVAPVIFLATAITHLFGGSAGREGAALQLGGLLGLDPGICGALGLVGLFCCATNSPVASMVLSIEMFGGANIHLFALVCVICFVLSGHSGLYSSQIIQFSKVTQLADKEEAK